MRILKIIVIIILLPAVLFGLYVGGNILYATITDYQPPEMEEVAVRGHAAAPIATDSIFSFMIWNIGYGGLGREMDFFYDGGATVTPPKENVERYLAGIKQIISSADSVDFILLQEVDTSAKRSHNINELTSIAEVLDNHAYSFGTNYRVDFIPIPFTNPMGCVTAGVASYSKYQPVESYRYSFPGSFDWPKRVFFLDRCFLTQRIPLAQDRELVVINTHNSAYDDGTIKKQEMAYLKNFLEAEYAKGNYVVAGGDWNQSPPAFDAFVWAPEGYSEEGERLTIEEDYLPKGWQWVYDTSVPSNRDLKFSYKGREETFVTLIDFFLVSPNVELTEVKGIDLDFENSDHQPVFMKIRLLN